METQNEQIFDTMSVISEVQSKDPIINTTNAPECPVDPGPNEI